MNPELFLALVVVALITSVILFVRWRLTSGPAAEDEYGLPRDLIGAEVAYAERTFRSPQQRLIARLDRAYRVGGELSLVELKTRERDAVYMSDVIELSVQRIALQDQTKEVVSTIAWVVVQSASSGARRPHKVRLMPERQVTEMRERYQAVIAGKVTRPAPARSLTQCAQCSHGGRCAATFRDR